MKNYLVKPEYVDCFGSDVNAYTTIPEDMINDIAFEWGKEPEDVLSMLIEDDSSTHAYSVLYRFAYDSKHFDWESLNYAICLESGDPVPFFESEEDFLKACKDGFVTHDMYYVTIWED